MDDHVIHLEQFYVQQNNYKSICRIHVVEHENFKFFAILELRDRRAHLHIDELIEGINFAFNKIFKMKSIKLENLEYLFEKSIKDLNTYIFDLIKLSELPIKVTGLHATIGMLLDNQLFLTQRGFNHGFFLFKTKNAQYQLFDILKEGAAEPPEEYIFKEIINGQLNPGQAIMFGTETVGSFLTEYNIKRILTLDGITQNAVNAHLKEITNNENFCGVILKSTIINARSAGSNCLMNQVENNNTSSLSRLQNTKDKTQELLTPTLIPKLKEYSYSFKNYILRSIHNIGKKSNQASNNSNSSRPTWIQKTLPIVQNILGIVIDGIKKSFAIIVNIVQPLIQKVNPKFKLPQKKSKFESVHSQPLTPEKVNTHQESAFSLKNAQNKTMAIGIVLIISAVFISGFVIKSQRLKAQEQQAHTAIIAQIDENFLKAESSIIHKAQGRATIHIEEINSLVSKLQDLTSIDSSQEINVYTEKIADLKNSLYQIRPVSPQEILDLTNELSSTSITQIESNNEKLYITSATSPYVTIADTKTNEITLVETESTNLNLQDVTVFEKNNNQPLFIDNDQNMYALNSTNNTFDSISIAFDQDEVKDIETFNSNLYTLSPKDNQIYKHRQASRNNFTRAQQWIKDSDHDLSAGIDMLINGSIYVLFNDGRVEQYLSGRKTDFKLNTKIEPAIGTVDSFHYSINTEKFYILDKAQKRILVYNEAGDFLYQYHLELEAEITGISINDEDTSILILAGKKVYQIEE